MKIKKLNNEVIIPTKAYPLDAGFDLYSPISTRIEPKCVEQIKLGIAIEINNDEVAITSERSGMARKYGIHSIGNIIDAGYRGEISIILMNSGKEDFIINVGDRIGQLLIIKLGNQYLEIVEELTETKRGDNAHFSSGI